MTNKITEALKLAEEALDMVTSCSYGSNTRERAGYHKALAAIREALAEQDKQEPVAYLVTGPYEKVAFSDIGSAEAFCRGLNKGFWEDAYIISPLYVSPVERQ